MKTRRFVKDELLKSIDVINTLSGGVSEPQIRLKQFPDHREIRVKVPGIAEEDFKAEIHNNVLSVFFVMNILSDATMIQVPKVVYNKQIPYFVDASKIAAAFDKDTYIVKLPFNSMAQGYHRSITSEL